MKHFFSFSILLFISIGVAVAQDFVTRGKIEFEVKKNNKRIYSAADRANNPYIATLPEFDISYRDLVFSWNQSIYQPGRRTVPASGSQNGSAVYMDLNKQQSIQKCRHFDEDYVMVDSIKKVKWKIENEIRKIAGWECRKAIGIIYDSVYVVAFYCPEIIPQGGPELFSGLPGMILGLAIPRYYTTWFATKMEIANIDESKIVPPVVNKKKQHTKRELAEIILKVYKTAGWWKNEKVEDFMEEIGGYLLHIIFVVSTFNSLIILSRQFLRCQSSKLMQSFAHLLDK
jgi:GLPGLI family protein